MEPNDIQKLRDLPIEGVAERLGLKVSRHKALCPFHQDSHPSLTFNTSRNTYKCFVCGAHGGPIDLAMNLLPYKGRSGGRSFAEACQWLADEHNMILTRQPPAIKPIKPCKPDVEYLQSLVARPVLNAEAQAFLFGQRHYNAAVIRWLGITSISQPTPCWRYGRPYYDAPSLLIPYRDVEGSLLSVQSRYLGKAGKATAGQTSPLKEVPRFRFPKGSKCHIFNLPMLKLLLPGEPLFVSEGITDCIGLLSAGHKAIAIPSTTLLNKDDMQLLKHFGALNLHIYPDQDVAGEKLYIELLHVATQIGANLTRHRLPEGCKDFSDYWMQTQTSRNTNSTTPCDY